MATCRLTRAGTERGRAAPAEVVSERSQALVIDGAAGAARQYSGKVSTGYVNVVMHASLVQGNAHHRVLSKQTATMHGASAQLHDMQHDAFLVDTQQS